MGFEPTEVETTSTVFKTVTFGHSVNSPLAAILSGRLAFPLLDSMANDVLQLPAEVLFLLGLRGGG